ncbi:MAG: hypothetical protein FWB73_02975 [Treponema sp.]|nr:hypothetical protein [Treponema sp.]
MKVIKFAILFILTNLFFFIGCNNYYNNLYIEINGKNMSDPTITFFSIHPDENTDLEEEIEGRINNKTNEIIIIAPVGSGLSNSEINPRFSAEGLVYVNGKIQKSGIDSHIYDASLKYDVVSANEMNRKTYTVTILEHNSKIFVNHLASGSGDGSSWEDAFSDLKQAFELAALFPDSKLKEIWIAAGEYKPSTENNTEDYFLLSANTNYVGGFAGNEVDIRYRDIPAYKTIISGDLGNGQFSHNLLGNFDGNIINIINENITFDGIEFINANAASAAGIRGQGAAISISLAPGASLNITNCSFINLDGGAVFVLDGNMVLTNSVFQNITTGENFGAVCIYGESAEVTGVNFKDITGGALSISCSKIIIDNAEFKNITGVNEGANNQALYINASESAEIKNVTIDGVTNGRGIYAVSYNYILITESEIKNCAITGHGGGIYLNNFGQAEISYSGFSDMTAVIGGSIFYIGNNDVYNSTLLLINIKYDSSVIYHLPHPQMHLIGDNITVR